MSATARSATAAVQPLVRAAWGGALLLAPRRSLALLGARNVPDSGVVVARVFGARHIAQALATREWPDPVVLAFSGATDALHAASGVLFAGVDARWRRAALVDAAIASAFAFTSWRAAAAAG